MVLSTITSLVDSMFNINWGSGCNVWRTEDAEDIIYDIRWEHGKWSEREASNIVRL